MGKTSKRKKEQVSIFMAGVLFVSGLNMAHMDYLGLERYVACLQSRWIDLPWYAGAIGSLIGAFCLVFYMRHPTEKSPETQEEG